MQKELSDENLVEQYLAGDENALKLLIKNNLRSVYNFVYQYLSDKEDADDVTQETFVKVWLNIKKFVPKKSFRAWLFRIAKNTALDYIKRKRPASFSSLKKENDDIGLEERIADAAPFPDELVRRADNAGILNRAVEKLSTPYRLVLFLYYYDGLNFREIAEALDEPLHTVKSRHRRALSLLRKNLAPKMDPISY
jgi:RNA polymerase sigma-70 factor (ECF subfamily)